MTTRHRSLALLAPLALALLAPASARPAGPPRPRTDCYGDPLPQGAVARLGSVRFRKFWGMRFLTFSPDGRLLASTDRSRLFLWHPTTGHLVRTLGNGRHSETPFYGYALSPDGRRVVSASGGRGEWLYCWDVATGKLLRRQKGPGDLVGLLAFAPDGRTVAGACGEAVLLWELSGWKCRQTVPAPGDWVTGLAFTADGKRLVCLAMRGESVRLLELEAVTGRARRRFALGDAQDVALAPGARAVVTFDGERGLRLWDVAAGKARRLQQPGDGDFSGVSFSPDGRTLLAADLQKEEVQFWDVTTGKRLRRVRCRGLAVGWGGGLLLSPDGKTLLREEAISTVRRWDARTGRPLPTPPGHHLPPEQLAFSADGRRLTALSLSASRELCRWDTATARLLSRTAPAGDDVDEAGGWCLSPCGRWVAGAWGPPVWPFDTRRGWGGTVRLFDTRTGKRVRELKGHAAEVVIMAFSGDGKVLATAGKDGVVRLWDAGSGKSLRVLDARGVAKGLNALVLSQDGRAVAVGGAPLRLHLWEAATGWRRRTLRADPRRWEERDVGEERSEWCQGCFTPDGHTLYLSVAGRVQVWDLAGRREAAPYEPHEGVAGSYSRGDGVVAVSPDGRLLAWLDPSLRLGLWETASGRRAYEFKGGWYSVAFSPGGRMLAAASAEDCSVLLWDLGGLFAGPDAPGGKPASPERLWDELASPDAGRAYRAVWRMAAAPGLSVPLLRSRLRPAPRADARRRLPPGEHLQLLRAVAALESTGSPQARELLEKLAKGAPEARLTQEAKAALRRLDGRAGAKR